MKHRKFITSLIFVLAASPVVLAKEERDKKPTSFRQQLFAKYNLDHDGKLDVSESER